MRLFDHRFRDGTPRTLPSGGEVVHADAVVAGLTPNTSLAEKAGLDVDNGTSKGSSPTARVGSTCLESGRGRDVLLWNTWKQVDAARAPIASPGPLMRRTCSDAFRQCPEVEGEPPPILMADPGETIMTPTQQLHGLGQSLWLDNITRRMLDDSTLERLVAEHSITGLTSNPTIFDKAISGGHDYDKSIAKCMAEGQSGEDLFFSVALEDLRRAADLFRPAFDTTGGVDGYASLEVSPLLADNTAASIASAEALHAKGRRDNLFIKIPGTPAGITAIEESIYRGVPINVTLLFSREQYLASAEAPAGHGARGLSMMVVRCWSPSVRRKKPPPRSRPSESSASRCRSSSISSGIATQGARAWASVAAPPFTSMCVAFWRDGSPRNCARTPAALATRRPHFRPTCSRNTWPRRSCSYSTGGLTASACLRRQKPTQCSARSCYLPLHDRRWSKQSRLGRISPADNRSHLEVPKTRLWAGSPPLRSRPPEGPS